MVETTEEYRNRINQIANSIENEPYMKNMRPDIAEGISKTGNRQADIEDQFQEVIDNTTGKDVIAAPELIAARNGEANLKSRLDKEQQKVTAQLAQNTKNLMNIGIPMPAKGGSVENSAKVFKRVDENTFHVIQPTSDGSTALLYVLRRGNGGRGSTDSAGSWDLLRLQGVFPLADGYVWYYEEPLEGALDQVVTAAKEMNNVEKKFINAPSNTDFSRVIGSLQSGIGVGANTIPGSATRTWELPQTENATISLSFYTSSGSSDDVDILVDGVLAKKVDCTQKPAGINNGLLTIEVDVSKGYFSSASQKIKVEIKNNTSNVCYFVAFNVTKLKDWKYLPINNFKFLHANNEPFIDTTGSSDYALLDVESGKWFGSYHGGEVLEKATIRTHYNTNYLSDPGAGYVEEYDLSGVSVGWWGVITTLKMKQHTSINGKAKVITTYDFDKNGTIEMDFGFYENTIKTRDFYTALTSTHVGFDSLSFPNGMDTPDGTNYFHVSEGKVVQRRSSDKSEMTIRFTRFPDGYNEYGPYVRKNEHYSKFYYGIVQSYQEGVVIPALNFSKGLDFSFSPYDV